jgi:hypothetical protein
MGVDGRLPPLFFSSGNMKGSAFDMKRVFDDMK